MRNRDNRGYAPLTIKSHAIDLKEFFIWLSVNNIDWSDVSLSDLEDYLSYLSYQSKSNGKPKNSNSSIRRKISSINSFYRYQTFYSGIFVSPLIVKRYYKQRAFLTGEPRKHEQYSVIEGIRKTSSENNIKVIDEQEYKQLLSWLVKSRDKLFFTLLWETGLRVGQALQLKHVDINYQEGSIDVVYRKDNPNGVYSKNKQTYKVFTPLFWLREYTNYLIEDSDDYNTEYLFCSIYNRDRNARDKPISYEYYKNLLNKFEHETGIHITCHMFRHTFVTRSMRNKVPIDYISRQVGHKSAVTTQKIYEHLNVDDLREVLERDDDKKQ
nr:site-specific integrase [Marinomonas algarum]